MDMAERDDSSQPRLFRTEMVPAKTGSGKLFDEQAVTSEPVECLGIRFESEDARRTHFLESLKEHLPELRKRPDFPLGEDDDILRLSDPPYYTACPNPFLTEFVEHHGRPYDPDEPYHREPFAVDVSEGKTDPLYRAHGYHTKVPHRAIVPSILHYTRPGDLILDGFCGSGMTGVAAQWCESAPPEYRADLETTWRQQGWPAPEWGTRYTILGDLSPAATFIAANYTTPFDVNAFADAAERLLAEVEEEVGWMYKTLHTDGTSEGRINYTVWSEVFSCPECGGEVVFLDAALDRKSKRVRTDFPCSSCRASLSRTRLERLYVSRYDRDTNETVKSPMRVPVLINYNTGNGRYEKPVGERDRDTLRRIEELDLSPEVPNGKLPYMHMTHERARMDSVGITHLHHYFMPRAAHSLSAMWRRANACKGRRLRNMLLFFVEQAIWGMSLLNRYGPSHYSQVNRQLSGVYYIGAQISEVSPWYILAGKLIRLCKAFAKYRPRHTTTVSASDCSFTRLPDNSIDYVFTDPPFGENIYYADLNYLVESWHRVHTASQTEAIIDQAKGKTIADYQRLMQRCFTEYCRVLKPGRWMTVVFHNSRNAVWNAIQEAMLAAGFVVADVRTLDKQQGSYRQVTSTAVKQDLVISAYKPNHGLEARFELEAGTEEGVWDFTRIHLRQLPVFVSKDDQAEVIVERQDFLLFDRMVAFHVQRGIVVPLSAAEFYAGLPARFPERDGMFFLPEQVAEYDRKRLTAKALLQLTLFVNDEASAIQWLKQALTKKPQTFQELHPHFIRELGGWQKHEQMPELSALLAQNFLRYDGADAVPSQIHGYLSSNVKDLRNRDKHDIELRARAKDRWYVPDPGKAGDLEKLRERALLKEFDDYRESGQRRLRVFRLEAVRAGFRRAWQQQDYATIIVVAQKIPDAVLQEDPKLLMWYDQAVTRSPETRTTL